VHLQKTGHAPAAPASLVSLPASAGGGNGASAERPSPAATSSSTGTSGLRPPEYSKLVRGQDVWLSGGGERTRRSILCCIKCGESFRSLPELTVHMVHTRHYTNIVGAPSAAAAAASGHVTAELQVRQQQADRTAHGKTGKCPTVTSLESHKSMSPGNAMTSSLSPPCEFYDVATTKRTRECGEYDVSTRSPASLPETETGRHSTGVHVLLN